MTAPTVAKAKVEIVSSDLRALGKQTEKELEAGLSGVPRVVSKQMGAAGKAGGTALGDEAAKSSKKTFVSGMGATGKEGGAKLGDETVKESKKRLGSKAKEMGSVVAGGLFGLAVGSFFVESVKGWQDHEVVMKATAQVIKSTGSAAKVTADQVGTLADSIEAATGVDGDLVQQGANMLLTFTNVRNEVGKNNDIFNQAVKINTDMAVAMGTDAAHNAIMLGKALNDPVKGVSALTKVGVTFTEQQKKQIKTMADSGNAAGAQAVILKELGKEFGGQAAAQETSGQKMQVALHALQDQIGQMLIPIITAAAGFLTDKLIPAIAMVATWVQKNIVPALVAMGHWLQKNKDWVVPLVGVLLAAVAAFKIATVVVALFNAVLAANPIILIVTLLVALGVGLVVAYNKFKTFRDIVDTAFRVVATTASWLWNNILHPIFEAVKVQIAVTVAVIRQQIGFWTAAFRLVGTVASWLWNTILHPIFNAVRTQITTTVAVVRTQIALWVAAFRLAATVATWLWNTIVKPIFNSMKVGASAVSTAFSRIGNGLSTAANTVKSWITTIYNAVHALPGRIASVGTSVFNAGKNLMGKLWSGLKSVASGAADLAGDLVGAMRDGINNLLHLPLKVPRIRIGAFGKYVSIGGETLIPRLAQGGMTDGAMTAVIGDNRSGHELVAPLDSPKTVALLSKAMGAAQAQSGAGGGFPDDDRWNELLELLRAGQTITVMMDGQAVVQAVNTRNLRNGRRN